MSILFFIISGALFIISFIGGYNKNVQIQANGTRILIASGIFAIAGVLA